MLCKRHELKYYLNDIDAETLVSQLGVLMGVDSNAIDSKGYRVRSLYFDSFDDECLFEKQSGVLNRQKYRLRTYGTGGDDTVKFEIKHKSGQLVHKESATIDRYTAEQVTAGNFGVLLDWDNPILDRIYATFVRRAYAPKVLVEYQRLAFVLPVSNIRVTFDRELHSNINHYNLFSGVENSMPVVIEGKQILEVKFDEFLPGYIKRVLSMVPAERMAISKYTLARRFHKTNKWEDN